MATNTVLSLPEMVYQHLRNAILNGTFTPGQVLRQEEVAVRLGVSRSPLREALPRLEAEGIVVLNPRRGYSVAKIEPEEITEAFDLRVLLEVELARKSIARRTDADIARVYAILNEMRAMSETAETADRTHWFELNANFHRSLLEPAKCPMHLRALRTTSGTIEAYVRAEVRLTGDIKQAQVEHSMMGKAFAAGDIEQLVQIIRDHSSNTRVRLLEGLARTGHEPTPADFPEAEA
ncbi:MAG TPA: GntR family transcriptional regulator [Bordetella sp.]